MKKTILTLAFVAVTLSAMAQTKLGTVDSDLLIASHPDIEQVQTALNAYTKELEGQMKTKLEKYQELAAAYRKEEVQLLEADKKLRQDEILKLDQELGQFRQNSAQLIQIKQNELLQPVYTKVGKALDEVAKAQGYTQVLTLNNDVAFFDMKYDLTKAVADKLGITLEEPKTQN